jgi:hypothetical protein
MFYDQLEEFPPRLKDSYERFCSNFLENGISCAFEVLVVRDRIFGEFCSDEAKEKKKSLGARSGL